MRIDPLPKTTPAFITQQPDGYAATLVNVTLDDGSKPQTTVYPTITEALDAAMKLAQQYNYYLT